MNKVCSRLHESLDLFDMKATIVPDTKRNAFQKRMKSIECEVNTAETINTINSLNWKHNNHKDVTFRTCTSL